MIRAIIFDLDGTLAQTEKLKALSYARAAVELSPASLTEAEVIEAFKDVVGLSRQEVAEKLIARFGLEEYARQRMAEFNVNSPWQAFVQVRLQTYSAMLADPTILLRHRCPYNMALLRWARRNDYCTGLATMSHCEQAGRVLEILEIKDKFDFIATRDDVEHGKPDPEIYLLVAKQLNTPPAQCFVIEDSASGVKAAIAAGMWCIVVTTEYTREAVYDSKLLNPRWIVDEPANLVDVAKQMIAERGEIGDL
ncbi:HAD family phosphatase [candidate division KSB1 bacterium]|nr:HAD family phosphatase [candidate division KSB1 bacterium]